MYEIRAIGLDLADSHEQVTHSQDFCTWDCDPLRFASTERKSSCWNEYRSEYRSSVEKVLDLCTKPGSYTDVF